MTMLATDPGSHAAKDLSFLWLEITAKCNLECVHCYADSGPAWHVHGQMSHNDWLTILSDAADLGCREVQFIGGEPTLHPDLCRMISFAAAHNYKFIEVYTNASYLDNSLLQVFTQYSVHVAVSFYSDDDKIHDAITKRRGSFDRTVANLRRMVSAGLPIRAGIIEMQENAGHGEKARQFLEGIGVTETKIDLKRGIGRAATGAELNDPMSELCGECWKGKLCVTSSGKAYPCVFSRFAEVGHANSGIDRIVSSQRLADFRRALRDYRRVNVLGSERAYEDAGCGPQTCSPACQPSVFKCAPGTCSPRSVPQADRRTNNSGTSLAIVEGEGAISACGPTCSPTCSPCTPGQFRRPPGSYGHP